MRKKNVLQLDLQLYFWIAMTTCNSLYFYIVSVIKQIAWVAKVCIYGAIHCNSIASQLQLCWNNSFSTIMQLHYDYNHNIMLLLLIFIRLFKSNTWHYKDFFNIFFWNIDFHHLLWLLKWSEIMTCGTIKTITLRCVNWILKKN